MSEFIPTQPARSKRGERMFRSPRTVARIGLSSLAVAALIIGGLSALPAQAATAPGLPETVGADVLPTPQINGVVWNVAVVGSTAYAVGSFTKARPYGAAAGVNEVVRNNAMAFDVTTGAILGWNPSLNAQARAVKASPDGTKLYVGGDFNTVSGLAQTKIAAFTLPSGALDSAFKPNASGSVEGLAVSNSTVYAGGSFTSAAGQPRSNLAAYSRANGALKAWAPTADDIVHAVVAYPDDSRVIVGGRFQTLNGQAIVGIGAVDGSAGAIQTWTSRPIPTRVGTSRSWVTDLLIKNGVVYGTGNGEGGRWFDGRFAATASNGDLIWLDNCYGASYGTQVIGEVAYSVSHSHDCTSLGTFPEQRPQVWKRALANTTYATGTDQGNPGANSNYSRQPIPTQLNWYPAVNSGSYTGIFQGGWSLGTNGTYLVMGGEFTSVNGKAQQGLASFATRNVGPNKVGPLYSATTQPSAISLSAGTARVAFTGTSDYDDRILTYKLFRDNGTTPIYTVEADSKWWALPQLGFVDTGLAPGSSHTYKLTISDPAGNSTTSPRSTAVVISSATQNAYSAEVIGDGAQHYWPLNEGGGSVVYDNAGFSDADAGTGVTRGTDGPLSGRTASTMNGTDSGNVATRSAMPGPTVFTVEAWFKTTSTAGGKIVGFGASRTGNSSNYDRHLYLDGLGRLTFGVYPGGVRTLTTLPGLNDGKWHLATGTLGSGGMTLYVDGARISGRTDVTTAQSYNGYWRIGGDNLNGWPSVGSSNDLSGSIGEVAVYPTALSQDDVASHYNASSGAGTVNQPPTAAFTSSVSNLTASVDASTSTDSDGTIASYAWNFGDSTTGTGKTASRTYAAAGSYTVTLTVTDDKGATSQVAHAVSVSAANAAPVASFTTQVSELTAEFDGSASSDSDGTIAKYAWAFGDGATGTGQTVSHPYAAAGDYQAVLTVTDDKGATHSVTRTVTVAGPTSSVYARDTFERTATNGFGTADQGGAWTPITTSSRFSVTNGTARILMAAGSGPQIRLPGVSATDTDMTMSVGLDKPATGGGVTTSLVGRHVSGGGDYRAKVVFVANGTVALGLTRGDSAGAQTAIATDSIISGLTYAVGDTLNVRLQVTGTSPTTVRAKVWKNGAVEPATWQKSVTDSTAGLQSAGSIGLYSYLSSSATNAPVQSIWDDLMVTRTQ